MRPPFAPPRRASYFAFLLLVAAFVGWMLSLPAWPSQDGPAHLYYTHVLRELFAGSGSVYAPFLTIKHLLPPYAVYYYSLLLLSRFVPLITADRLFICGYLLSFAFGFRYAARAVGPGASRCSALACVLLLNWALGMGFANFCLSLSFALWAIGVWLRLDRAPRLWLRAAFVGLMCLITLSHPVPLLVVLSFSGLDLACRFFFAGADTRARERFRGCLPNLLTLAVGALPLLYVRAFTVAHPLEQRSAVEGSFAHQVLRKVAQIVAAKSLGLVYGHWWEVLLYRIGLVLLLVVPACLAALHFGKHRRRGQWGAADSCFVLFVLFCLALPLLPSDISGAYYFSERLTIVLWILALLAASAWTPGPANSVTAETEASTADHPTTVRAEQRVDLLAALYAVALGALLLHLADTSLRPLAVRQRNLANTVLPQLAGRRALLLAGAAPTGFDRLGPAWNPYKWDTAALLQRNNGVLENAPWLDSPIIPLAPTPALQGAWLPRLLANSPADLRLALDRSPLLQQSFLGGGDLLLISPVAAAHPPLSQALQWAPYTCSTSLAGSFSVCQPDRRVVR